MVASFLSEGALGDRAEYAILQGSQIQDLWGLEEKAMEIRPFRACLNSHLRGKLRVNSSN